MEADIAKINEKQCQERARRYSADFSQEPFATYLAAYNLTGVNPRTGPDGNGISNSVEFILGGNPTRPDVSTLPTSSDMTSSGTAYLVCSFYTVTNLGSVTWLVELSTDLITWSTVGHAAQQLHRDGFRQQRQRHVHCRKTRASRTTTVEAVKTRLLTASLHRLVRTSERKLGALRFHGQAGTSKPFVEIALRYHSNEVLRTLRWVG